MAAITPARRSEDPDDLWAVAAAQFEAWRAGEPLAFDQLVRNLTPVLWQVVRAYGLQTSVAEDVIQDTWFALARNPGQVRDARAVGGWLLTTARRSAWRAGSSGRELVDSERVAEDVGVGPAAEDAAIAGLEAHALWKAVATLSERCRRLLRIVAFDDHPDYEHIAEDFDMPIGSIGPTRRRCLDKLRSALEGNESV